MSSFFKKYSLEWGWLFEELIAPSIQFWSALAALTIVGHLVIDHIFVEGTAYRPTLGGTPTYAGVAASMMGSRVEVVSKVGHDFPDEYLSWLSNRGLDVSGVVRVDGARTTSFRIVYDCSDRRMTLLDACDPLNPDDIPPDLRADGILLGPVANEIPVETCRVLSGLTKCLSLDPQGYLRRFGPEGTMIDEDRISHEILRLVQVLRASEREISLITGLDNMLEACQLIRSMGPDLVIVTRGPSEIVVVGDGVALAVPSWPSRVVDPTGAGDAFFGVFLSEFLQGKAVDWCSCVGAASASFVVEGYGPSRFGSAEEIQQRAHRLMKDVKFLES